LVTLHSRSLMPMLSSALLLPMIIFVISSYTPGFMSPTSIILTIVFGL